METIWSMFFSSINSLNPCPTVWGRQSKMLLSTAQFPILASACGYSRIVFHCCCFNFIWLHLLKFRHVLENLCLTEQPEILTLSCFGHKQFKTSVMDRPWELPQTLNTWPAQGLVSSSDSCFNYSEPFPPCYCVICHHLLVTFLIVIVYVLSL